MKCINGFGEETTLYFVISLRLNTNHYFIYMIYLIACSTLKILRVVHKKNTNCHSNLSKIHFLNLSLHGLCYRTVKNIFGKKSGHLKVNLITFC